MSKHIESNDNLSPELRLLAAMSYGEASARNNPDEIFALASVLKRQRDARGYESIMAFVKGERSFSFVISDGNPRYAAFKEATDTQVLANSGMRIAVEAARNALADGPDKSANAWFWDGADIKTNYSSHVKVKAGIRFSHPSHNIYGIPESTKLVIHSKIIRERVNGTVRTRREEVYRYDHIYESTTAHGGTIFWRFSSDYVKLTRSKPYK